MQENMITMEPTNSTAALSWAACTQANPYANFGDALSPVMVAAISGLEIRHAAFDSSSERMVAVGTIGHAQKNGILHFWGTGLDATRNPYGLDDRGYFKPENTVFHVHATRGPRTAAAFRAAGIEAPSVFGDPVWLLPRIWSFDDVKKTAELGIIVHISELESREPDSAVLEKFKRYGIPESLQSSVKIIRTLAEPTLEGLRGKVEEILSCKRILSTSLHGLVIPETYGVPCAWFANFGDGVGQTLDLNDDSINIDHRIRDFYLGLGQDRLSAYCLDRSASPNWEAGIKWIDETWQPVDKYSPDALIESFPLELAEWVRNGDAKWPVGAVLAPGQHY
jgi:hypothetical protein